MRSAQILLLPSYNSHLSYSYHTTQLFFKSSIHPQLTWAYVYQDTCTFIILSISSHLLNNGAVGYLSSSHLFHPRPVEHTYSGTLATIILSHYLLLSHHFGVNTFRHLVLSPEENGLISGTNPQVHLHTIHLPYTPVIPSIETADIQVIFPPSALFYIELCIHPSIVSSIHQGFHPVCLQYPWTVSRTCTNAVDVIQNPNHPLPLVVVPSRDRRLDCDHTTRWTPTPQNLLTTHRRQPKQQLKPSPRMLGCPRNHQSTRSSRPSTTVTPNLPTPSTRGWAPCCRVGLLPRNPNWR